MKKIIFGKGVRIGIMITLFGFGWFCGAVNQHRAEAQLKDIGKAVMEQAGEQEGALGAVAKLGTSIADIQEHLDALQKNVDTLKSVKSMLGG
ncbi:MAG: hypothetical protein U5R49_01485 [Deltaproteobacteria bacterium]|nr:hypothetical protein [Deltaproteobacteria bacterium]